MTPFEQIRHEDDGVYWLARELAPILDYSRWQRFWPVVEKAMTACETAVKRIQIILPAWVGWSSWGQGQREKSRTGE